MAFTIVQLTDPHIGASWSEDPLAALAAAVAAVGATLPSGPDAVIVSGDIASTPDDAEYEQARAVLDVLDAPLYVLPGNHDDRGRLRRRFAIPEGNGAGLSYVAELGPVRLVAVDTQRPGQAGGQLDAARLDWLDRVLDADRGAPTLLAMHHPPLLTGIPAMDAIGIPEDERRALAEIVSRRRQVQLIAAGHVHRAIIGELSGTPVLAIPSTDVQLALDFEAEELRFVREPPCFAVHALVEGRLVSHIQPVATAPR
ncbi:MAG TPA: metallophosphoesterase [Solirubrobacteraceae bacterium]